MRYANSGVLMLAAVGFMSLPVVADTVDSASVTTFESGSTLSSQDMNATINALVTAINDNAARIAELENAVPTADVSGRNYCINEMFVALFINDPPLDEFDNPYPLVAEHGSFSAGISFVADGSGSATAYADDYVAGVPGQGAVTEPPALGVESFTWTQTGNRLEMTFPGEEGEGPETIKVGVANTGRVMVAGGFHTDSNDPNGTYYATSSIIGIEVDNVADCDGIFSY